MNKKNLREMAEFLIKIDYRKSPFYKDLPKVPKGTVRTAGYALEQYLWFWSEKLPIKDVLSFLEIETLDIWQWCFSPEWEKLAATKGELKLRRCKPNKKLKDAVILTLAERETGQRILYLLDYGLPDNWECQMNGEAKLIWKNYDGDSQTHNLNMLTNAVWESNS